MAAPRDLWCASHILADMRIAAISDIHGNLAALEAVLADIARRRVDMVVNLGDILSGPLQPRATAARLIPLNFPTIAGNHERQMGCDPAGMRPSDRFAHDDITDDQRDWMRALPATLRPVDDVLMVHGTPASDTVLWLDGVSAAGRHAAAHDEVRERAGTVQASLFLCGHTHLPRSMLLDDGRLIVNPGSVGLQAYRDDYPMPHKMENGTPHARYAIVERSAAWWSVEHLALAYDWEGAAAVAQRHGRADWAYALRTGRMP